MRAKKAVEPGKSHFDGGSAGAAGGVAAVAGGDLTTSFGAAALPRCAPEFAGVSRAALERWLETLNAIGSVHSALVARHGTVVAEAYWAPYGPDTEQMLFSVSKTVTALAVGFAISERLFAVTDKVATLLDFAAPDNSDKDNLADLTVHDLLTMGGGHRDFDVFDELYGADAHAAMGRLDWVETFLGAKFKTKPGAEFNYNTASTYLLSAIITKLTGLTLLDYVTTRLFQPLGIVGANWDLNPQGINMGGFGLSLKTEDLAKIGQLILGKGQWNGQQLLPATWISEMTKYQIGNLSKVPWALESPQLADSQTGYGYQMWICRFGAVRADGIFGQYVIIWPKYDAVIVMTAANNFMEKQINAVWDDLGAAFDDSVLAILPDDDATGLGPVMPTGLQVPPPQGSAQTATGSRASGVRYRVPDTLGAEPAGTGLPGARQPLAKGIEGAEVGFEVLDDETIAVQLPPTAGVQPALFGPPTEFQARYGSWHANKDLGRSAQEILYAAYAWVAETTLEIVAIAVPSLFAWTWRLEFAGADHEILISATQNVAFAPTDIYETRACRNHHSRPN